MIRVTPIAACRHSNAVQLRSLPTQIERFTVKQTAIILLAFLVTGCDPRATAGIAVRPPVAMATDSAARAAFAIAGRIAGRYGFEADDPTSHANPEGWQQCYTRPGNFLCGKTRGRDVFVLLSQYPTFRLTSRVEALRRELLDSLRNQFGAERVRVCRGDRCPAPNHN